MKRLLLTCLLALSCLAATYAQIDVTAGVGMAFPVAGSDNAPDLRTSFVGSLAVGYRIGADDSPWRLVADLDGLHWTGSAAPDRDAVPMDEGVYNRRYLFFPLTIGASYDLRLSQGLALRTLVAMGGYYRYQNCLRLEHPGVLGDLNDSGFGFALKSAIELLLLDNRLSLGMSFFALGNPFETTQTAFPARNPAATATVRHNSTLEGFSRCFIGIALGYKFL